MTKLYAYGDSYTNQHYSNNFPGWVQMLAERLNCETINRGVSGGSTEYAMLQFIERMNMYASGDIIIVQLSTPGRLHFQYQNKKRPDTASKYWHYIDPNDSREVWYHENKDHIKWYIENFDNRVNSLNHNCYIHALQNFAETRPDVTFVLLQNRHYYSFIEFTKNKPDNFLEIPIDLFQISHNEFVEPYVYDDWIKKTVYDSRINHLSNPNLIRLTDLLEESIETGRTDNFTYSQFQQHVFEPIVTMNDYKQYVSRGLIYDRSMVENNFKL